MNFDQKSLPPPVVGSKLPVLLNTQWIQAEILSIRFADSTNPQYYCHFDLYNKRLDEWVMLERMDLNKVKLPSPKKKPPHPKVAKLKSHKTPAEKKRKRPPPGSNASLLAGIHGSPSVQGSPSPAPIPLDMDSPRSMLAETPDELESNLAQDQDTSRADIDPESMAPDPDSSFSKEKEIEKLRTSGSMTQSHTEISRLKNINRICIGKSVIDTWYFSPYPEDFTKLDVLFICQCCLEPVGTEQMLARHRQKCQIRHPPGNEIYRHGSLSFFELDGRKQRHYCRNLCLISKLFLDHKTLYYEVDPFLYYIMTRNDERGMHVLGYFSKEKQSAEEYNVACILTLPQYQRMGYGKLLIDFSYQLTKIERKTGSPEKPLSDLGLLSYRSYWADTIVELLMENSEMSVQQISETSSITADDIMQTLQSMDMIKFYKNQFVIYLAEKTIAHHEKNALRKRERIDPSKILWSPLKFLTSQLNFL